MGGPAAAEAKMIQNKRPQEPTILIVDDHPTNLRLLERILKTDGYRVVSAASGPEARRLAALECPELIMLDIVMPGENGFQTCARLKQSPLTADIPVIFVSSIDDTESKVTGLSIGGVDYITKPFAPAEVLARTRLHLNLKTAYQALVEIQSHKLKQLKKAQQAMLPRSENLPAAAFDVRYTPVNEAGGDFYDVIQISKGIFGYFVADISGHDLGASYLTAALKALINQNARPGHTPVETMKILNRVLHTIMRDGQYLTGCYAYLNRNKSHLTVINAGHPEGVYVHAGGACELMGGSGDILGAFDKVVFEPFEKQVAAGDRFFLYSDGLIETCGEGRIQRDQGLKKLMQAGIRTRGLPKDQAIGAIVAELFETGQPTHDDFVLMVVDC
jgi:sigma-B regulation protein RsbU (phosphoserine phosphatase)